jgi:hypothetical protein
MSEKALRRSASAPSRRPAEQAAGSPPRFSRAAQAGGGYRVSASCL